MCILKIFIFISGIFFLCVFLCDQWGDNYERRHMEKKVILYKICIEKIKELGLSIDACRIDANWD